MASANYPACLNFTFKYEGGYVNHPKDPGGPTNFGITQNVLAGWRGRPVSSTDVKNMTRKEAGDIYRANYWNAVRGDDLPAGVDLVVWDWGVNSGPTRAVKALQKALGVRVDGFIGAATLDAAAKADARKLVDEITAARQRFVRGLSTYKTFGKGWEARISACRALALSMVKRPASAPVAIVPDPEPVEAEPAKARAEDERILNSGSAQATVGGGVIGGAVVAREGVAIAREAVETGKSASDILASVGPWLLLGLVVVAFAAFILWQRRKQIRSNQE